VNEHEEYTTFEALQMQFLGNTRKLSFELIFMFRLLLTFLPKRTCQSSIVLIVITRVKKIIIETIVINCTILLYL